MSILLDALKKSEEQRQLGQAPSIHSPAIGAAEGRNAGSQWIALAMMSLAAVAMAWFGWQQLQPPAPAVGDGTVAAVASAEAGSDAPTSPNTGETAAPADASADAAQDATAEGPVARRPQLLAARSGRTPVESVKTREPERPAATPSPKDPQELERPRAGLSQSVKEFASAEETPSLATRSAQSDSAGQAAADPADRQPAGEASGANAAADPRATAPISFWELPQSVRDALPELRITVLVYAEDPENRFVLIEGQRVVEKDTLSDGVVLEEIRRDGAVFEYRNYRFLVEG